VHELSYLPQNLNIVRVSLDGVRKSQLNSFGKNFLVFIYLKIVDFYVVIIQIKFIRIN